MDIGKLKAWWLAAIVTLGAADVFAFPTRVATNAPQSGWPQTHVVVGDVLLYRSREPSAALWRSDGTTAGTFKLKQFSLVPEGGFPSEFISVGGSTFFTASDAANGIELWKTEGTEATTGLVKDVLTGSRSSMPTVLTNVGGTLYFAAYVESSGIGVWKSDGTAAGTVLVKSGLPPGGGNLPAGFAQAGAAVVFAADDGEIESQLWRTDGTTLGTSPLLDADGQIVRSPVGFAKMGDSVLFTAFTPEDGQQLWRTDGTPAGTSAVRFIEGGVQPPYESGLLEVVGTTAFFIAGDDAGRELWRTDGTPAGTYRVSDICPGPCDSSAHQMVVMANTLYFVARDETHGLELWRSDGTAFGTRLLKDVKPGNDSSFIYQLTAVGDLLFFSADDGIHGQELWVSDGTEAGTRLHTDLTPGPAGTQISWLAASSRGLFFATQPPTSYPLELWFEEFSKAPCAARDTDLDGLDDCIEEAVNRNPAVKDNDVFTDARLFVMQQYRDVLGREGDAEGINYWTGQVSGLGRSEIIRIFLRTPEFLDAIAPVARLYFAYFLRIPDYSGLNFWTGYVREGNTLESISQQFAASPEFVAMYGSLNNAQFVDQIYRNVLGRAPDDAGLAFWTSELDSGARTRGNVMLSFSNSSEYSLGISNEVCVAMIYHAMMRRAADPGGFDYWTTFVDQGNTGAALINHFITSAQYRGRFMP